MPKNPELPDDAAELRSRAEARLSARRAALQSKPGDSQYEADTQRLLHELEVHQVELEMQNAELQQSRDNLERAVEKYTDLYDFAPIGFLTLNRDSIIQEANLAAATLLGIARSTLVKQRFSRFVSVTEFADFRAFLKKVFASSARQSCEVTVELEGKQPFTAEVGAIISESGKECRLTLMDITGRKRAEADRLIVNKLESTGILAGGIAHDFNNLLTVLLLNVEMAREFSPPGGDLMRHLEDAIKAGSLARELTAKLMSFSSGGSTLRKPMLLPAVIRDTVGRAVNGFNVRTEFSLAENLEAAEVDELQLGQAMRNLILNACEAMPHGGGVLVQAKNVLLSADDHPPLPAGNYIKLSVVDQGEGIAADVLPKIFDPYFSTKQRGLQKGMGLGLTIAHAVVKKHNGAMVAQSTAGVGTTVHIILPACRVGDRPDRLGTASAKPRHGRIIVMDDDAKVKQVTQRALQKMGHEVELVSDGRAAIAAYGRAMDSGKPVVAVLLDLEVPEGMGGKETIEVLQQIDPAVKAIAMSGHASDPAVLRYGYYGFKAVLTKPFSVAQLDKVLTLVTGS